MRKEQEGTFYVRVEGERRPIHWKGEEPSADDLQKAFGGRKVERLPDTRPQTKAETENQSRLMSSYAPTTSTPKASPKPVPKPQAKPATSTDKAITAALGGPGMDKTALRDYAAGGKDKRAATGTRQFEQNPPPKPKVPVPLWKSVTVTDARTGKAVPTPPVKALAGYYKNPELIIKSGSAPSTADADVARLRAADPNAPGNPRMARPRRADEALQDAALRQVAPTLTGAGTAALLGALFPPAAPVTVPLGFLGGSFLGGLGQDKALAAAYGPGAVEHLNTQAAQDAKQYPVETLTGENLPGFIVGKPSLSLSREANVARAAGAALGIGAEGYQQLQQDRFDPARLLTSGVMGGLGAGDSTPVGQAIEGLGQNVAKVPRRVVEDAIERAKINKAVRSIPSLLQGVTGDALPAARAGRLGAPEPVAVPRQQAALATPTETAPVPVEVPEAVPAPTPQSKPRAAAPAPVPAPETAPVASPYDMEAQQVPVSPKAQSTPKVEPAVATPVVTEPTPEVVPVPPVEAPAVPSKAQAAPSEPVAPPTPNLPNNSPDDQQKQQTIPAAASPVMAAPETTTTPAQEPAKPPAKETPKEAVVRTIKSMRMADIEETARELGIEKKLDRSLYQEGNETEAIKSRAIRDFDKITGDLDQPDALKKAGALSPEEAVVAHVNLRRLADEEIPSLMRQLDEAPDEATATKLRGQLAAATEKAGFWAELGHKAGSEAGRRLALQKAFVQGPLDGPSLVRQAEAAVGGPISGESKQTIYRLSERGKKIEKNLKERVVADADAAEARIKQENDFQTATALPKARKVTDKAFGTENQVFTAERATAARERLRAKIGQANSGLDPEYLRDLIEIGGYYVEGGYRKFDDWAKQMRADIPELTEGQIQTAWANIKADLQERIESRGENLKLSGSFVDSIGRRIGRQNAADFINALNDEDPNLLETLVKGSGSFTPEQNKFIAETYRANGIKRTGKAPEGNGVALIRQALAENRAKAARKPAPRVLPAEVPLEAEKALVRSMGREPAQKLYKALSSTDRATLEAFINGDTLTREQETILANAVRTSRGQKPIPNPAGQIAKNLQAALKNNRPRRPLASRADAQTRADAAATRMADARLEEIGTGFAPLVNQPQKADMVSVGVREYMDGARDLAAFTKAIKKRFGGGVVLSDDAIENAFTDAALKYRQDFKSLEDIKRGVNNVVAAEVRKNRPTLVKIGDAAVDILSAGRALTTSLDLSAPFRQGGLLFAANPRLSAKNLPDMVRAFANEDTASAVMASLETRPNAQRYKDSGLYLADYENKTDLSKLEEAYRSNIAEKIPGIGKGVRASERAYVTFLNKQRADTFDMFYNQLTQGGKVEADPESLKAIANFINAATGRGTGKVADGAAGFFNGALFSPRFMASRFQVLTGGGVLDFRYGPNGRLIIPNEARKAIARTYAQAIGSTLAAWTLAELSGAEIEKDPRSANFGKIRWGNLEVDGLAGMAQTARFIANLTTGEKKGSDGSVKPVTASDTVGRFMRSKTSPLVGSALDLRDRDEKAPYGKDYLGRDVSQQGGTFANVTGVKAQGLPGAIDYYFSRNVLPMNWASLAEGLRQEGMNTDAIPSNVAALILGLFGFGTRVLDKEEVGKRESVAAPPTLLNKLSGGAVSGRLTGRP